MRCSAWMLLSCLRATASMSTAAIDALYPGTAVARLNAVQERVKSLSSDQLSAAWPEVRRSWPAWNAVIEHASRTDVP